MVFPNSVLLGQNLAEILFLLWLAFWTKKLQKHNWKRIPYGIAEKNSKKTQRLTHLWPKARSSFFSEWTVEVRNNDSIQYIVCTEREKEREEGR